MGAELPATSRRFSARAVSLRILRSITYACDDEGGRAMAVLIYQD